MKRFFLISILLIILTLSTVNASSIDNELTINDNSLNVIEQTSSDGIELENEDLEIKTNENPQPDRFNELQDILNESKDNGLIEVEGDYNCTNISNDFENGSFDELSFKIKNAAEGDILLLEKDYKYLSGLTDGILIDKPLVIDGQGHCLDGNNLSRIFNIKFKTFDYDTPIDVTLKNIKFINGNNDTQGSVIYLVEDNSEYSNDYPDYPNYLAIQNCTFTNNTAKGSAIYSETYTQIHNCIFTNNTAENGGAMSLIGPGYLYSCNFTNNAAENGGAIYWDSEGFLNKCTFNNNTAKNGGAIYWNGGFTTAQDDGCIYNCIFTNNHANSGGGIYCANGRLKDNFFLKNSLFENNYAELDGGAFKWTTDGSMDCAFGKITNCTFTKNYAANGGAISSDDFATYEKCIFKENHADNGSAIYNGDAQDCYFESNIAKISGGAIYDGKAINCTFKNDILLTRISTKITAPSVTTVYNGGKYLIVTLKDKNNNLIKDNNITIKLNDNSYPLKTNKQGQVKLTTNNLAPNKYVASIVYLGDDNYLNSSAKTTITVKKATPKITAYKKTFKIKVKTKKYAITLKNNKGNLMKKVKLTLKVKGHIYKATTNSKGKATFKITKLTKKGTYKTVIKFGGSKYYKSVSKITYITIKK